MAPLPTSVLIICTGNAARSVMVGALLAHLADDLGLDVMIKTAGTHAVDGQPPSMRTRTALAQVDEHAAAAVTRHRSHHLEEQDLKKADLVVGMERDHISYVRRHYPWATDRTATIKAICAVVPKGDEPLSHRVVLASFDRIDPATQGEVEDPAGKDDAVYLACAEELFELTKELVLLL